MGRIDIKYLTIDEIKEAFPNEIKEIVPRLIDQLEDEIKDCQEKYNIRFNKALNYFPIDYAKKLAEEEMPKNKIKHLNNLKLLINKDNNNKNHISENHIINAKNVDIRKLYDWIKPRAYNDKFMACCPFHEDNTPSFMINTIKNTFKCFSCGKYGDSISFIIETKKINFIESVKFLNKVKL